MMKIKFRRVTGLLWMWALLPAEAFAHPGHGALWLHYHFNPETVFFIFGAGVLIAVLWYKSKRR